MSENTINSNEQQKSLGTLDLLKKICAEKDIVLYPMEDDHWILAFDYDNRRENFFVEINDENGLVKLTDYAWYSVSKWDIEEVTRLQTQISICNSMSRSRVVYHFDDDDDNMVLSTVMTFSLLSETPYINDYFISQLVNMLQTHYLVLGKQEDNMEKYLQQNVVSAYNEEDAEDSTSAPEVNDSCENRFSSKEIVLECLTKLQCEPVIDEEAGGIYTITFEFQAEQFYFRICEGYPFVMLYDAYWYSFDADDIEQFDTVKKIINEINWQTQPNFFYY